MKSKILFLIIPFLYSNNFEFKKGFINESKQDERDTDSIEIITGKMQTEFINFNDSIYFTFDEIDTSKILFIHIFSIDCQIEVELINPWLDSIITNNHDNNAYSMKIFQNNSEYHYNNIIIKALKNKINEINYRTCPLVINSFFNGKELEVKEQDPNIFFFDNNLRDIKLFYNLTNIKDKSFISFSFLFNEKATFEIEILETKQKTIISNSHSIFLTRNSIQNLDFLHINMHLKDENENTVFLTFRVMTNNDIPLILQKNYLNQGFITSNIKGQYYYMDIFKDEEGEIILHDKRRNGKLKGIIRSNKKEYPINIDDYDQKKDDILLEYNEHFRKIYFSYNDTEKCEKGCHLLITYYHENFSSEKDIIGFEFTLLVRIWNKDDWSDTNILNIPNNEYIFGHFYKNRINHHYYSIFINDEIEKIIIEIKGYNYQFYYGQGKKKLNTYNSDLSSTIELNIENEQAAVKEINVTKFKNKDLSFAIRPKLFSENIESFYNFRVFKLKNNEFLIMPLDSNIENICKSQQTLSNSNYHCFYLLKNDYNQFSLDFIVTTTNPKNEFFKIYYSKKEEDKLDVSEKAIKKIIDNSEQYDIEIKKEKYINNNKNSNLSFILFVFEYDDKTTESIFSCFNDTKKVIYPQIYTAQVYLIESENLFLFNLSSLFNYYLIARWINGEGYMNNFIQEKFHMDINTKGRSYSSYFFQGNDEIKFSQTKNFVLYFGLSNNDNEFIEELKYGEQKSKRIIAAQFPLYFFIENKLIENKTSDINFRIYDFKDDSANFIIEGKFINEKKERRDYEKYELLYNFKGQYDKFSKNGLLQINNNSIIESNIEELKGFNFTYILIKVYKKNNSQISDLLIDIIPLEKGVNYFLSYIPLNQFISGSLNQIQRKVKYYIDFDENENNYNNIVFEFSKNNPFLNFDINKETKLDPNNEGIEKYYIKNEQQYIILTIYFNKTNITNNLMNGNYIFRFYYDTNKFEKLDFEFTKIVTIKNYEKIKEEKIRIFFEIDNLKIKNNIYNISFRIYCNIFYKEKINEKLNTISIISEQPIDQCVVQSNSFENKFLVNFTFNTENINNYECEMQIKFFLNNYNVNNAILAYSIPIDLKKILRKKNNNIIYIILLIIVCSLLLIIIIFFSINCFRMKKKNKELKDKVLSISFSTVKNESIISDDSIKSKKDEEYESTFI